MSLRYEKDIVILFV